MAGAGTTPSKGASTSAGSLANREIVDHAKRTRTGQFLQQIERLIAFGYVPEDTGTVKRVPLLVEHLWRDLPRCPAHDPAASSPFHRRAQRVAGRRPITLTTDQAEALEASRKASAVAASASRHHKRLISRVESLTRLTRLNPTPHRLARLEGLRRLLADASRDLRDAEARAWIERCLRRRAFSLPDPRPTAANRSRHRRPPGTPGGRERTPRWWECLPKRKAASGLRNGPCEPPRWRDLSDEGLIYTFGVGAYALGRPLAFSSNLTREVQALARSKPEPAAWLRALLVRHLKAAIGRGVELLVVVEENALGALHLHGIIAGVEHAEDAAVRDALKLAGGKGFRGQQVDLTPFFDTGWCSYIGKDLRKPFGSRRFAATRGLRVAAEQAFNMLRAFVLNPGKLNTPDSEDQSGVTLSCEKHGDAERLIKAIASSVSIGLSLRCGQQREAVTCREKRSHLTGSRTCWRQWKFGGVPILDSS